MQVRNSDIFFYPGTVSADLVLSLFNTQAVEIDPELYWVMSLVLALLVWSWVWRISIAIIKKTFGFEQRRPYS